MEHLWPRHVDMSSILDLRQFLNKDQVENFMLDAEPKQKEKKGFAKSE